jgi:hypothetical protein
MTTAYKRAERPAPVRGRRRIMVALDETDIAAVDRWAIPAGEPTRSAALRTLIRRSLKAVRRTQA